MSVKATGYTDFGDVVSRVTKKDPDHDQVGTCMYVPVVVFHPD